MSAAEALAAKKRRTFFGKVEKCGSCHTCLHPSLKRACLVNRPPEVAAAANASRQKSMAGGAAAAVYLGGGPTATEALIGNVEFPDDKPVPAHGVQGFRLPIEPSTRAKKWTRTWVQQNTALGGGSCWLLRWVPDGSQIAGPAVTSQPPDWPGTVAPRHQAVAPEERLPPWSDTTTRAAWRAAALQNEPALVDGGDAGASPGGGIAGGTAASPGCMPLNSGAAAEKELPPVPPGWHACTHPGCGKSYETTAQLKRHVVTHRERNCLCPFPGCGKAFGDASKLARHQVVHSTDRDLVCRHPGCGRIFTMATHLATHSKTHQTENLLPCPYPGCSKKYAYEYKRKAHIAKHVAQGDGPPPAQPGDVAAAEDPDAGGDDADDAME